MNINMGDNNSIKLEDYIIFISEHDKNGFEIKIKRDNKLIDKAFATDFSSINRKIDEVIIKNELATFGYVRFSLEEEERYAVIKSFEGVNAGKQEIYVDFYEDGMTINKVKKARILKSLINSKLIKVGDKAQIIDDAKVKKDSIIKLKDGEKILWFENYDDIEAPEIMQFIFTSEECKCLFGI
ncbi:hypothetical protein [uncultured Clostridium sp.]|uniref:hypothetical protein n=1 Tax=uncultured Clostridium sp. TaxID=59620 RepID=UPI0028EA3BAA|nr:hypothetical protein [uncultured Clostridium sp.]